jgi:hypothetical protein
MNEYFDQDEWSRALRRLRISATRAGELAGYSGSFGRQVAQGLLPDPEKRKKMAKALGLKPEDLWKPVLHAAAR